MTSTFAGTTADTALTSWPGSNPGQGTRSRRRSRRPCGPPSGGALGVRGARYRSRHGRTSASDVQPEHPRTLFMRQDQLGERATIQFAHLTDVDPASIGVAQLAGRLREGGMTIKCTPVSITLDTGAASLEAGPGSPGERDGQFPLTIPHQRKQRRTPTKTIPQT